MNKKIILFCTLISLSNYVIPVGVQDERWGAIASDIAKDGEGSSRGEFEAAKQAFLNITSPIAARTAAIDIQAKWQNTFKLEASAFTENDTDTTYSAKNPQPGSLLSLNRYPTMNEDGVLKETVKLFKKPNIKNFLESENIDVSTAKAENILKNKGITIS